MRALERRRPHWEPEMQLYKIAANEYQIGTQNGNGNGNGTGNGNGNETECNYAADGHILQLKCKTETPCTINLAELTAEYARLQDTRSLS